MKIERTIVFGWEPAIEDMRNPLDSWADSDSDFWPDSAGGVWMTHEGIRSPELGKLGPKDLELACKLIKRGAAHRKFLREIIIWSRLTLPRYVWQELDTYKVATVRNSCSTMHKLGTRDLTQQDFELPLLPSWLTHLNSMCGTFRRERTSQTQKGSIRDIRRELKNALPEGYLQRAGYLMSYEGALKMYFDRRHHRLPEWAVKFIESLCAWIEHLPYMPAFIEAATVPKVKATDVNLSERDVAIVRYMVTNEWQAATLLAHEEFGWFEFNIYKQAWGLNSEREACEVKLEALGLMIPWSTWRPVTGIDKDRSNPAGEFVADPTDPVVTKVAEQPKQLDKGPHDHGGCSGCPDQKDSRCDWDASADVSIWVAAAATPGSPRIMPMWCPKLTPTADLE